MKTIFGMILLTRKLFFYITDSAGNFIPSKCRKHINDLMGLQNQPFA